MANPTNMPKTFNGFGNDSMCYWLESAVPSPVTFSFYPELGPPSFGYSITYLAPNGQLIEVSDRWEQSIVLKRLAEECWSKAQA